jgi:hypothetical protein
LIRQRPSLLVARRRLTALGVKDLVTQSVVAVAPHVMAMEFYGLINNASVSQESEAPYGNPSAVS